MVSILFFIAFTSYCLDNRWDGDVYCSIRYENSKARRDFADLGKFEASNYQITEVVGIELLKEPLA